MMSVRNNAIKCQFTVIILVMSICLSGCSNFETEKSDFLDKEGSPVSIEFYEDNLSVTGTINETSMEVSATKKETSAEEETYEETTTEKETSVEKETLTEETFITAKPNSDGSDLYPVSDDTAMEGNILPYDLFTFCYWKREDAKFVDGVYIKHYERPLVVIRNVEAFTEMDNESERVSVPLGTVYTAERSDGENWIYLQDANDEYSGWLHIIKEDNLSYRVENGNEIYQLDNVFAYDSDGADFGNPSNKIKLNKIGVFENTIKEHPFVALNFKEGELTAFLETYGSELDEELIESLNDEEQHAREYISEGWSYMIYLYIYDGGETDYLRYMYDDYSDTLSVFKYNEPTSLKKEQDIYYQIGHEQYCYESELNIKNIIFVDYDDMGVNTSFQTVFMGNDDMQW